MRIFGLFAFVVGVLLSCTEPAPLSAESETESTMWRGALVIDSAENIKLPFLFEWADSSSELTLINAEERIPIHNLRWVNDSVFIRLEPYDSEICAAYSGKLLKGEWRNYAKGPDYSVPFFARRGTGWRFLAPGFPAFDLSGTYQVWFGDSADGFAAKAELQQKNNQVWGTFRTETGDYRFLEGIESDSNLMLSCFDGAHAFLFMARAQGDSLINGMFYSGNHYRTSWWGVRSDTFELQHPDSLTVSVHDSGHVYFKIPRDQADTLTHDDPRFDDKITLIQIMGTWCPNCKDETEWLKEIYKDYGRDKVEIIAVSFEHDKDPEDRKKRTLAYQKLMTVPYDMFYGGHSKKELVTDLFPTLNEITSFPTLIVMNEQREAVKIHTGFNGPATSKYKEFDREMRQLLDSLTQL